MERELCEHGGAERRWREWVEFLEYCADVKKRWREAPMSWASFIAMHDDVPPRWTMYLERVNAGAPLACPQSVERHQPPGK